MLEAWCVWESRKVGRELALYRVRTLESLRCRADALMFRERGRVQRGEGGSRVQMEELCLFWSSWLLLRAGQGGGGNLALARGDNETTYYCFVCLCGQFSCRSCAAQCGGALCSSRSGTASGSLGDLSHLDLGTRGGRWENFPCLNKWPRRAMGLWRGCEARDTVTTSQK